MLNLPKLISKDTPRDIRVEFKEIKDLEEAKKNRLKEFEWSKGIDELAKELDWGKLVEIRKLILEIRYLQSNGDAAKECTLETEAVIPNYFKGLVGIGNSVGTLDQKLITVGGQVNEKFYLVKYLRELSWDGSRGPDVNISISKIKNGEDVLLEGIDLEKRLGLYKDHFEGLKNLIGLYDWELDAYEAIVKELGKYSNETAQNWTNKLKAIDGLTSFVVSDTLKTKWTALPNKQFDKVDKLESLVKEVLDSDNKVDTKFITEATAKKASLTSLAEVMKEDPKEVIILVERYKYNKLDDSATNEKDKKKTQQTRRIKKALKDKDSNFDITKDLDDTTLNDALYKVKVNELVINTSKYYTADLKEITTDKPNEEQPPFLRWNNPWVYAIGALAIGIVGVIIFWDKVVAWFDKPADEQGKDDNEEDDD